MWTVRGRTFESRQFKIPAIFHPNGKICPPRIITNIPLNPLMPTILLDNPGFRLEINVLLGAGSILHNCSLYQSTSPPPSPTNLADVKVAETESTVDLPPVCANRFLDPLYEIYFLAVIHSAPTFSCNLRVSCVSRADG